LVGVQNDGEVVPRSRGGFDAGDEKMRIHHDNEDRVRLQVHGSDGVVLLSPAIDVHAQEPVDVRSVRTGEGGVPVGFDDAEAFEEMMGFGLE
jgi:hypothetical protein